MTRLPSKISPGSPLSYPAEFFNLQVDMATQFLNGDISRSSVPPDFRALTQGQWCYVKNVSGSDRAQFDALKIQDIVFSPTDRLVEFKQNFAFEVGTSGDDSQPIVVLLEPIKSTKIGRALVSGMTPARLQVNDSSATHAILDGSSVGRLKTSGGGIPIIYKAGSSGEQWAVVNVSPISSTSYVGGRYTDSTGHTFAGDVYPINAQGTLTDAGGTGSDPAIGCSKNASPDGIQVDAAGYYFFSFHALMYSNTAAVGDVLQLLLTKDAGAGPVGLGYTCERRHSSISGTSTKENVAMAGPIYLDANDVVNMQNNIVGGATFTLDEVYLTLHYLSAG